MRILRASHYQRMPWKNGGGETFEIAISPPQATFDTMEWRISMALVAQDGPFSMLAQIDRTLCVLDGAGMDLDFGSAGDTHRVTPATPPFPFAADRALQARLIDGGITDLNVMTRRGRYRHAVRRMAVDITRRCTSHADVLLVFCEHGELVLTSAAQGSVDLGTRDCTLFEPGGSTTDLQLAKKNTQPASACVIELHRV